MWVYLSACTTVCRTGLTSLVQKVYTKTAGIAWKRQGDNETIPESVRSRIFAMSKLQTQPLHLRTPEQCPLENQESRLRSAKRWRARATRREPFQRGLSTVDPSKRWTFRLSTWASDSEKQRPDGPIAMECDRRGLLINDRTAREGA